MARASPSRTAPAVSALSRILSRGLAKPPGSHYLRPALPTARAANPEASGRAKPSTPPYSPCTGGACLAAPVSHGAGRSLRHFSPSHRTCRYAVVYFCALSLGFPPAGRYPAPCCYRMSGIPRERTLVRAPRLDPAAPWCIPLLGQLAVAQRLVSAVRHRMGSPWQMARRPVPGAISRSSGSTSLQIGNWAMAGSACGTGSRSRVYRAGHIA